MTIEKRGMNYREAMAYVGVKRRTFDEVWRPYLNPFRQGSSLIFDRQELDAVFDEFKRLHAEPATTASDAAMPVSFDGIGKRASKALIPAQKQSASVVSSGMAAFNAVAAEVLAKRAKSAGR